MPRSLLTWPIRSTFPHEISHRQRGWATALLCYAMCRVEDWEYYLTSDGRLIAYDGADLAYHEADISDQTDVASLWNYGHPPEAIAKVSGVLGFSYTVDI